MLARELIDTDRYPIDTMQVPCAALPGRAWVALFIYDRRPGMVFTQEFQDRLRYPDATPFLGALTPAHARGFTVRESRD